MLTDNVLAFGVLNLDKIYLLVMHLMSKARNGQFHFGINLTFGREKERKPGDEEDNNRAKAVSSGTDSKETNSTNKPGTRTNATKTVLPNGNSTTSPNKRTDYNSKAIPTKSRRLKNQNPTQSQTIMKVLKRKRKKYWEGELKPRLKNRLRREALTEKYLKNYNLFIYTCAKFSFIKISLLSIPFLYPSNNKGVLNFSI